MLRAEGESSFKYGRSLAESVGSVGLEDASVPEVAGTRSSPEDGKLDLVVPVLVASGSSDLFLLVEDGGADDRDGVGGGAVVAGHFGVQLADSSVQGDVSVLLVHVVVASAGLVPEDDAEGLDVIGSALEDLVDREDLSLGALGLELATQVVPELGLGDDFVAGEETDGVDLGVRLLLGGQFAAQHEVLSDLRLFTSVPSFGERSPRDLGRP